MSFKQFKLKEEIYTGLRDLRYEEPTPIQEKSIPLVLDDKDVLGSAQTGTGKTGAFVIPLLQKILESPSEHTQALILSPTRELAQQIDEQIFAIGYHSSITSAIVIGGSDFSEQAKAIRAGVDIIVATPGRLLDQMNVLGIDFSHIRFLVLDEADRMVDMGFLPDVTKIVDSLPKERQTLFFSATLDSNIQKVVKKIMKDPVTVAIKASMPVESVDQQVYFVQQNDKIHLVEKLFDENDWETALIFTATKRGTDQLERTLKKRGINAISMHGDRSQEERNKALRLFTNKIHPVMVATDVLSRGIDIDNISVIINYDVPNNPEDYIHRIGRTGRYDKSGTAITLVNPTAKKYFDAIHKVVGDQITVKSASQKKEAKKKEVRPGTKKAAPKKQQKPQAEPKKKEAVSSKKLTSPSKETTRKSSKKTTVTTQEIEDAAAPRTYPPARQPAAIDLSRPEIIEKAVARNRRARKPAKGLWGIFKSMIPKIKA